MSSVKRNYLNDRTQPNCFLVNYKGAKYKLPTLLSWDFSYGLGSPCDAFELSFIYKKSMLGTLSDATRFCAEFNGDRVFTGVVDEFELRADENGMLAVVRGRGMAALLLDNEAGIAEYYPASLELILEKHVYPWGIKNVRAASLPNVQGFKVSSGQSQWGVVENYAWFCGGIRPRVDRDGVLLLNGEKGRELEMSGDAAIIGSQSYTEKRYGVISSALVINKSLGISSLVEDEKFIARGGACRRVVTVPKLTWYDAMRHTGAYQLERSKEGSALMTLSVPSLFAAFPGDSIKLTDSPLGLRGLYYVEKSRCRAGGSEAGTTITLSKLEE